jgi:hypothetical protein
MALKIKLEARNFLVSLKPLIYLKIAPNLAW